jgi:hypothetical protein
VHIGLVCCCSRVADMTSSRVRSHHTHSTLSSHLLHHTQLMWDRDLGEAEGGPLTAHAHLKEVSALWWVVQTPAGNVGRQGNREEGA